MSTDTSSEYVGQAIKSVGGRRLLTGGGCYSDDFNSTGQLYAAVVRSNIAHGVITGIDLEPALAMPGVVDAITVEDIPDKKIPIRLIPTENAMVAGQRPLPADRVRFVGEAVAVVVATDPYLAEDAAGHVQVSIDPLPAVVDNASALEPDAPLIHPELGSNLVDRLEARTGDSSEEVFANADLVVKAKLGVQRHASVPMEPRALLAEWDEENQKVAVWGAAKVKHFNRKVLADFLEIDVESVRLVEGDVGGGFGGRGEFYPEDFLIPWLAKRTGRPVKWTEDRRDNLLTLNHSREADIEVEIAVSSEGDFLGLKALAHFAQGAYTRTHGGSLLPGLIMNHLVGPYRWPSIDIVTCSVLSNKTPAGTYRGPGQYEGTFARERVLDIVAKRLEMDPAELRRRNLVRPEDLPYEIGVPDLNTGEPVNIVDSDYPLVYGSMLTEAGYEDMKAEVERRRADGEIVGLGTAAFIEMGSPGTFEQATVTIDEDGVFTYQAGIGSVGQGVETVMTQVAADALGLPMDRIRIRYHDTDVMPEGLGVFASRCTMMGGRAVVEATRDLQANALAAAAERLGVDEEQLELDGDVVRRKTKRKGKSESVTMAELGVEGYGRFSGGASDLMMGSNLAMIGIDPETGETKILRYVISYDCGRAINPLTLTGQLRGGAVQGLAGAFFEEFAYSPDGQPLSTSFLDYAMPTASEMPDFETIIHGLGEQVEGDPISGAKGGGEGGIIGTAPTVANAIADAIGGTEVMITQLPIRPQDVLERLNAEDREPARIPVQA